MNYNREEAYIKNLKEISSKLQELDNILFEYPARLHYSIEEIEWCALLIRKILEKIAFGILILNYNLYLENDRKIDEWNIKRILKVLNKVSDEKVFLKILPCEDGKIHCYGKSKIMNQKRFFQIYSQVSGIIHEKNPFKFSKVDENNMELKEKLDLIRDEIVTILNRHEISGIKIIMKEICENNSNYFGATWK